MISLLLTVFVLSVVAMVTMVIRKAIAIRGLPQSASKAFSSDGSTPHPHRIRRFVKEIGKEGVHIVLLTFTKGWLLLGKEWRKLLHKRFPKVHSALYSNPMLEDRKESSFFLATITEYKEKTKRLRERIHKGDVKPKKVKEIDKEVEPKV